MTFKFSLLPTLSMIISTLKRVKEIFFRDESWIRNKEIIKTQNEKIFTKKREKNPSFSSRNFFREWPAFQNDFFSN